MVSISLSILNVIPPHRVDVAITNGQRLSVEFWWWGDEANAWWELANKSGVICHKGEVQTVLGQLSGIPARTLRYYADIAAFFSPSSREQYEPLSFSMFSVARSFGDRWEEVLGYALDRLEQSGRLPSCEQVEFQFSRNAQPILEADSALLQAAQDVEGTFIPPDDEIEGKEPMQASRYAADLLLSRASRMLLTLVGLLDMIPFSDGARHNLQSALDGLHQALEEARVEVNGKGEAAS